MSKAFTKEIKQNSSDSHQSSPAWMLTFVRWENRDTYRLQTEKVGQDLSVRKPMVVINDCISVSTMMNKSTHTPAMQAILKAGDVNYETAVAPGDFVFVNIVNSPKEIENLYTKANASNAINGVNDGFKGLFKIQSVRRTIGVDPQSGTRQIMFQIDGFSHTEFNNSIYFNPYLVNEAEFKKDALFVANIGLNYKALTAGNSLPSVQTIVRHFIENFLGKGVPSDRKSFQGNDVNFNTLFKMPDLVGKLLGEGKVQAAKDIYVYLMGIQQYSATGTSLVSGMTPIVKHAGGRFYNTKSVCQGVSLLKPEYWNQVPVWSILNQYLNKPINEMFNCFRIAPNGKVMPTLIMRQAPFSTEGYKGLGTKFLNLPRWKISANMIYDINIGRDEAARINFVQVFSTVVNSDKPDAMISFQINRKNYRSDTADISRSGLRPYVITSNFDSVENENGNMKSLKANVWAELLADQLIGGHLKLNGSITCVGIQDPITIGDNLELDGVVYHIEAVTHNASISPGGHKMFRTTLQLSNGIDKNYTASQPRYAEMENTDIQAEREKQWKNDRLFTGYSDEQMIPGRENGIKTKFGNNPFLLKKRGTKRSPTVTNIGKKVKK